MNKITSMINEEGVTRNTLGDLEEAFVSYYLDLSTSRPTGIKACLQVLPILREMNALLIRKLEMEEITTTIYKWPP
jgi:hypothetical protein